MNLKLSPTEEICHITICNQETNCVIVKDSYNESYLMTANEFLYCFKNGAIKEVSGSFKFDTTFGYCLLYLIENKTDEIK